MMKNFVISLTTADKRREHITQEFIKQDIDFEFFDAITPQSNQSIANALKINISNTNLTPNEIGCLLSHLSLWQKSTELKLPYVSIFEDDVYLSKNANLFLSNTDWIKEDWHIIKIEKINNEVSKLTEITKKQNHYIGRLNSKHLGGGGYILSQHAIKELLNFVRSNPIDHIDQLLFNKYFSTARFPIYQINPALCIQDCILYPHNQKFESSLQWRNNLPTQHKPNLTPIQKIRRELIRPVRKTYLSFTDRKTKISFIKND